MRVRAEGRSIDGHKFREACETIVVNAHGGLIYLMHEVEKDAVVVLVHPDTQETQECRVVYLGEPGDKGQRVGVEFLTPAPHFWGLDLSEEPAPS